MTGIAKLGWSFAALGLAAAVGGALFLIAYLPAPSPAGAVAGVILATIAVGVVLGLAALLRDGGPTL